MKTIRDQQLAKDQSDLYNALTPEHRERTAGNLVVTKLDHVKSEFVKLNLNLTGGRPRKNGGNYNARTFGGTAASRVRLNAGINNQKTTFMITGSK